MACHNKYLDAVNTPSGPGHIGQGCDDQGTQRSRDASTLGSVVKETHRPRDALSKGRIVQGTHRPRDASSKGRIVQGTENTTLFILEHIVQGHIVRASAALLSLLYSEVPRKCTWMNTWIIIYTVQYLRIPLYLICFHTFALHYCSWLCSILATGLTAIEAWMLSCILFVFGALVGNTGLITPFTFRLQWSKALSVWRAFISLFIYLLC